LARVTRNSALQDLLDLFPAPAYLEVGVNRGVTFHALAATTKVAVDPKFDFSQRPEPAPGCSAAYHEVTSDTYFGTIATDADRFDVIYLDGLHTFEQTLRDLINAVEFLTPQGVIVIDDVRPNSYPASLPVPADVRATRALLKVEKDQSWMGDVYKLVFFVETFFQQFSYATIQNNHGQMVMWRQRRAKVVPRGIDVFSRLQFFHCATELPVFRIMPFEEILALVKAARAAGDPTQDKVLMELP
jgi:hypothetical protein